MTRLALPVRLTWICVGRQIEPQLPLDAPPEIAQAAATLDPNGPSLFTAIQEQLGLKLESKNEQIDVIVIDHVEKPTPD